MLFRYVEVSSTFIDELYKCIFQLVQGKISPDVFADWHFANFKLRNGFFSTQIQASSKGDGEGRLFCWWVSPKVSALSSGGLRIPPPTWELLRVLGCSTTPLTLGSVLLPGALRPKAAPSQTRGVLWGRKKFPNHTQIASKALHRSLLVGLVGWKSSQSLFSFQNLDYAIYLQILKFYQHCKKDLRSKEKRLVVEGMDAGARVRIQIWALNFVLSSWAVI